MQDRNFGGSFILGLLIALGMIGMGFFVSSSVLKVKSMERSVSVKGLAEKEVRADTAIFPIGFQNAAPTMSDLNAKVKADQAQITAFLAKLGFKGNEITIAAPQFSDRLAQGYGNYNAKTRYAAESKITVYSKKVDNVIQLQRDLYKLTDKGVFARNEHYETRYIFTGLNEIKPEMIEIATKNAREAADKFAKDSHSKLGKIKKANQGYFSINDRDASTPHIKKVRVVTNISYYLDD